MGNATRGAAMFGAGLVLGLAAGLFAAHGRSGGGLGPTAQAESDGAAHVAANAPVAPDRTVWIGRPEAVEGPARAGRAGERSGAEPARGAGGARGLPPGDPTARIVADALRAAAAPHSLPPHAAAGATATAAAGEGRAIGRISGRVRRPDGTPIPGAIVTILPAGDLGAGSAGGTGSAGMAGGAAPGAGGGEDATEREAELAREVRDAVVRHARYRALSRSVGVGPDGSFAFEGLAPIPFDVHASHPSAPIDRQRATVLDVLPDAVIELTGVASAPLTLQVLRPDGGAAAGAWIDARGPSQRSWTWEPDAATVWVQPGTYVLDVTYEVGGLRLRAPEKTAVVEETEGPPIVIELRPAPRVTGRVLPAAGPQEAPDVTACYVNYARIAPDQTPSVQLLNRRNRSASPQPDGRYSLDDVGPGRWMIGVARYGHEVAAIEVVDLTDGPVVKDLVLPPLDESTVARVRVLGPDGAPRGGAEVRLVCRFEDGNERSNDAVIERPGGHYLLLLDEWLRKQLAKPRARGDRIDVSATVPGLGTTTRRIPTIGGAEVTVQLGPSATLAVTIEGMSAAIDESRTVVLLTPAEGAPVAGGDPVDGAGRDHFRNPDASGHALLGPIEAGSYVLRILTESERARGRREVAQRRVELAPGENATSLAMPALGRTIIDGVPPGSVWIYPLGADAGDWLADVERDDSEGERVELDLLPPGAYALVAFGASGAPELMTLRVAGASTQRFIAEPHERIEVRAAAVDDDLRAAGIERGDVLVAISGRPIADPFKAYQQFDEIPAEATAKPDATAGTGESEGDGDGGAAPAPAPAPRRITVARGGRAIEINVDEAVERSVHYGYRIWRPVPRR